MLQLIFRAFVNPMQIFKGHNQGSDLRALEQQLPGSHGIVVGYVPVRERADVALHEIKLAGLYASVTVLEMGTSLAQGLDFGTQQNHACLNDFEQKIFMPGFAVSCYYFHIVHRLNSSIL